METLWTDGIIEIGIMPVGKYYDTMVGKEVFLESEMGVICDPYFADNIPASWARYASKKLSMGYTTIL